MAADPRARTMHKDIIKGIRRFGHLRSRVRSELLDWIHIFIIKDLRCCLKWSGRVWQDRNKHRDVGKVNSPIWFSHYRRYHGHDKLKCKGSWWAGQWAESTYVSTEWKRRGEFVSTHFLPVSEANSLRGGGEVQGRQTHTHRCTSPHREVATMPSERHRCDRFRLGPCRSSR